MITAFGGTIYQDIYAPFFEILVMYKESVIRSIRKYPSIAFVNVQWHAEMLVTHDNSISLRLYGSIVEACKENN